MATLKPFVINLNDLLYLLEQVNFVPLFDGPANSNGIVDFDPLTMDAWDAKGNQVWTAATQSGSYKGLALDSANVALLGTSFPHVSSSIGVRDVSGLHNNLFGSQADWGAVDVPFRRDIAADFSNYVTSPGADYTPGNSVIDLMPRIISRTITTAGVNLLRDNGGTGAFVEWDAALYAALSPEGVAYKALIDGAGVDTATLVEGAKIVAPVTTEIAVLDANGVPLVWHQADYLASAVYAATLGVYGNLSFGGLYGSATGGALVDSGPIYYQPVIGTFFQVPGQTYQPSLLAYKQLVDGAGIPFTEFVEGEPIVTTLESSGYGLLETLGHIDFQNPTSGEYFIGSENPGVAPVNSWFGIFGQFFDHGLDFIGKGSQSKITIQLETTDPLYRAPDLNIPGDQGNTKITVTRATIAGTDANGDPNYVNHTSPFIDQSQTYGSVDQVTQLLRKWESTDNGMTYQAGMELFDGATLVDAWARRWPDGSSTWVHDTLPTLNELRQHVIETGRDPLTWEDVLDYRNRDDAGQLSSGTSGHALLLDMNPHFDGATGPGEGHISQAALDKLSIAQGGVAGGIPAASFNIGMIMPYLNPDFSINTTDLALHDAVSDILMDSVGDHYIAGDGRVNENFGLTSIHHVFHEEHNYQVENLKSWIYAHDTNNPGDVDAHEQLHNWQINTGVMDGAGNYIHANGVGTTDDVIAWDADKMFQATKLVVEMEYQHAAVDQYARTITPRIQEFVGYSTGVDPTISLEYAQVAFRFGHSTIRETIDTLDPSGWMLGNVTRYALEKAFLAPQTFAEEGVAAITLGLSRQQMNEVDEFVTPALTQGLLDLPLDLPAINIARGRDLGIPTLNDFREGISLARYTSWADFGANMIHPESLVNFIAAYSFNGDVALAEAAMLDNDFMHNTGTQPAGSDGFNHIDSWIGGLAEAHVPGGLLGETFDAVFVAQIQSLMDGDRFYYLYRLFGTQLHEEVNNGQFKDIVERNTGLSHLNGSIFAYADKYYDFNRNADGTLPGEEHEDLSVTPLGADDVANHFYASTLAANSELGIFSDGGASIDPNGELISVTASDFVRADVVSQYIRDVRPELDPTQVHTVEGTPTSGADSHEVIVATDRRDFIHGRAGDDTIYGEGGDDFLFGDGGVDRLYGGDGNDMIDTGEGPDLADGGAGKDIIYGRGSGSEVGGFDQLVGGSGNDLVIGGEGIDKLSGGSGDDIIYGDGLTNPAMGNTDAFTHGGDGNDYIDTGASGDLLYGEEGDDYMVGGIDQDLIQGGYGDDILRPGSPSQAINGGPDEVIGDNGGTENIGFDLMDLSDYAAGGPGVVADLATQTNPLIAPDGQTPFPAWFQMEGVIGTSSGDTLTGDSAGDATAVFSLGGNWLIGGSGNDTIRGNGGNDLLIGGSIRLDSLIGTYVDAAPVGNLVVGSAAWLAEAMQIGGAGTGYDDNSEDLYSGASNRAFGDLQTNGLLDAAGMGDQKHFTEMLRSRMFKDVVLGDSAGVADTGSSDVAVFSGARGDYDVSEITFTDAWNTLITAYKVVHARGTQADGTDLVVGVEAFRFADTTLSAGNLGAELTISQALPGTVPGVVTATASNVVGAAPLVQWQTLTGANWVNSLLPGAAAAGAATIDVLAVANAATATYRATTSFTDAGIPSTVVSGLLMIGRNNATADTLTGSAGTDILYGRGGNDTLDAGTSGADMLYGGLGNDIYVVSHTGVTVTELANQGTDTVQASINYALGANFENLTLTGVGNIDGTGTIGNNLMIGNAGNNVLDGGVNGTDTLRGGAGNDTYIVNATNDTVDERLLTAAGAPTNDTDAGGIDTVVATLTSGTYTLVSSTAVGTASRGLIENLTLGGTANVNGTGNALANVINGNSGVNILIGGAGGDTIAGLFGDDTFRASVIAGGTDGDDSYDGGDGIDTLDLSLTSASPTLVNLSDVNRTLAGETLLAGTATSSQIGTDTLVSIENVTGSSGANIIVASSAANVINGLGGNDVVAAVVDDVQDTFNGGTGTDTADYSAYDTALNVTLNGNSTVFVFGSGSSNANLDVISAFENFTGGSAADFLSGSNLANVLDGGDGGDTLFGGNGADTLIGGLGDDTFVFGATAHSGTTATTRDTIVGFEGGGAAGGDVVDLSGFTGTFSFIGAAAFDSNSTNQIRFELDGSGNTVIQIDNDGSIDIDASILLLGYTGTLLATDFSL